MTGPVRSEKKNPRAKEPLSGIVYATSRQIRAAARSA
jgi:hypothetical protein